MRKSIRVRVGESTLVSSRGDEQNSRLVQSVNRIKEGRAESAAAIAVVQRADVRALSAPRADPKVLHLLGITTSSDRIRIAAVAGTVQKPERHQLHVPVESRNAAI